MKKILIGALILRLILILISSWHPDMGNHIDWGIRFLNLGPKKFYENIFWNVSWINQPFGTTLLFGLVASLKNLVFGFIEFINQNIPIFPSFLIPTIETNIHAWMLKLPFVLADIGLGVLIYRAVHQFKPKLASMAACVFLFNPVVIYNSTIWGQTDSLINLLALTGLYLTFKKHYFWGIFIFLSTFLFKLSLIIYIPIFGLLLLKRIKDWPQFIAPIILFIIFIYGLAIPFAFGAKNPFDWLWYMYTNRVLDRQGSMLNGNAFNLWFLIFGLDFSKSEFTQFYGITYQLWSRLLLVVFLVPVCFKFLKSKLTLDSLLIALLLTAFGAFIFLTNMHERYLYPIFPIMTILFFSKKSFFSPLIYVSLSFIHLLNLYNLWFYPDVPVLKTVLESSNFLIGKVFSATLISFSIYFLLKYLQSDQET